VTTILVTTALITLGAFVILWLISVGIKDASIADPFWGASFVLVTWVAFAQAADPGPRQALVVILVTIWGTRLAVYLTARNRGHGEDYRYQAMRRRWGRQFPLVSLATVFALQATLVWVVSLPVLVTMLESSDLGLVGLAGTILWIIGLIFEATGDWQLARFKKDPTNAGIVLDRGLWRYTRHPNYFGDFCAWWGIFLVAVVDVSMLWTVAGPIVMSTLLLRVSGVALLEDSIRKRRPGYEDYMWRTSAFFPWKPRELPSLDQDGTIRGTDDMESRRQDSDERVE